MQKNPFILKWHRRSLEVISQNYISQTQEDRLISLACTALSFCDQTFSKTTFPCSPIWSPWPWVGDAIAQVTSEPWWEGLDWLKIKNCDKMPVIAWSKKFMELSLWKGEPQLMSWFEARAGSQLWDDRGGFWHLSLDWLTPCGPQVPSRESSVSGSPNLLHGKLSGWSRMQPSHQHLWQRRNKRTRFQNQARCYQGKEALLSQKKVVSTKILLCQW